MKVLGLYFSGTGNTKHCVDHFAACYDGGGRAVSIEEPNVIRMLNEHDFIVFGYPVYYSNVPKIVSDFLFRNETAFRGKQVFVLTTMAAFSGDGAGCGARILSTLGAEVVGGLHLVMPDCIGDEPILKRSPKSKQRLFQQADEKISCAVEQLRQGKPPQEGLSLPSRILGLLGQRLWFSSKTAAYQSRPRVDAGKCTGCECCVAVCPMGNLELAGGTVRSGSRCTLCYRCFGHCPAKALTILGRQVHEQYLFEKYK